MNAEEDFPYFPWTQTAPLRAKAAAAGTAAFFESLPEGMPEERDVAAAERNAERAASEELVPELFLSLPGEPMTEGEVSRLSLRAKAMFPRLALPRPEAEGSPLPLPVGIAAALGSLAGMAVFAPAAELLLGNREGGIFLGAPLGALAFVLAVSHLGKSRWLLRSLMVILGLATLRDAISFAGGDLLFSRGWTLLGKKRRGPVRILLFPALFLLLLLAGKGKRCYDRARYEASVKEALLAWADGAVRIAAMGAKFSAPFPRETGEECLEAFAAKILSMEGLPPGDIPQGLEELVSDVKNLGFRREGKRSFPWHAAGEEKYRPFGAVEEGDLVTVEMEPLLRNGRILSRGVVRRVRPGREP